MQFNRFKALLAFSFLAFSLVSAASQGEVGSACTYNYECVRGADCISVQCLEQRDSLEYLPIVGSTGSSNARQGFAPPAQTVPFATLSGVFIVVVFLIVGYGLTHSKPRTARRK